MTFSDKIKVAREQAGLTNSNLLIALAFPSGQLLPMSPVAQLPGLPRC